MSIQSASMICMNRVSRHKVDYLQAHRDYSTFVVFALLLLSESFATGTETQEDRESALSLVILGL